MGVFLYPTPVPVLPTLNGFSVHKKPIWASLAQEAVSGREITTSNTAYPLWEFDLTYEGLRSSTQNRVTYAQFASTLEYEAIATVFLATLGPYGRFYYDDPTDNSRTNQLIGYGDGSRTEFTVFRSFGTGSLQLFEPIGGLNPSVPFQPYVDTAPVAGSDFQIGDDGTFVEFINGFVPTDGSVITMDFSFYYRCRFLEDVVDFEQFMYNLWTLRSLKFRSVKDGVSLAQLAA